MIVLCSHVCYNDRAMFACDSITCASTNSYKIPVYRFLFSLNCKMSRPVSQWLLRAGIMASPHLLMFPFQLGHADTRFASSTNFRITCVYIYFPAFRLWPGQCPRTFTHSECGCLAVMFSWHRPPNPSSSSEMPFPLPRETLTHTPPCAGCSCLFIPSFPYHPLHHSILHAHCPLSFKTPSLLVPALPGLM